MRLINYLYSLMMLTGTAAIFLSCQTQSQPESADSPLAEIYTQLEFDMPRVQEPDIPARSVNITDFGAIGDGLTDNSKAFSDAIADVAAKGGGKVIIPRGVWSTGPITLKSNINLHAEAGALILFSDNFDLYPLIETSFEGLNTFRCLSPINGRDLENIAITGKGVFDGSGDSWRYVKKGKVAPKNWKKIVKSGGMLSEDGKIWFPTEKSKKGHEASINFNIPPFKTKEEFQAVKDFLRPVMVSLVGCDKVLLDGPTFQNSPAWNIHPLMSENVIVRNLTVRNPWYAQNGDGIDLESCKNVLIYNNTFDVGDDAICFKSGKNEDGRARGIPTENVIVTNNTVYHGHGGFVIGSEMSGGVRNVHVSKCTFIGTDVGLRFKSTRGRGGVVDHIYISDINMINIPTEAIRFNMFYSGNSPILEHDEDAASEERDDDIMPVTEETPSFRNIFMNNITATGLGQAALFQGLPEMKLANVNLTNAVLQAQKGIVMLDTEGVSFDNVMVQAASGPALTVYNSKNAQVKNFVFQHEGGPAVRVLGKLTDNIKFEKKDFDAPLQQITTGMQATEKAYSFN